MKIIIFCPGSFTCGLNSPERGEGRWAQNYAKLLAQAGHEVYAASAGMQSRTAEDSGVRLIDQMRSSVDKYGPYDLFIDSAWWDGKKVTVEAKKKVSLNWSPESHLHRNLPDDFYIGYPYISHHYNFHRSGFPNGDRTFALPTMFGDSFSPPNWEAKGVFLPGKIAGNQGEDLYKEAITTFLSKHPLEVTGSDGVRKFFGDKLNLKGSGVTCHPLIPYNEVLGVMQRCRISLPIMTSGAMIEAAFMGVPSVFWEHGGFFTHLGQMLGISIAPKAPAERFTEVVDIMMYDKKRYHEIVHTVQDYFVSHTFSGAIKYFNFMCDNIGLSTELGK